MNIEEWYENVNNCIHDYEEGPIDGVICPFTKYLRCKKCGLIAGVEPEIDWHKCLTGVSKND